MNHKWKISLLVLIGSAIILTFSNHKRLLLGRKVEEMKSPAGPGSSEPNLHKGIDGNTYLTWIETHESKRTSLYYSTIMKRVWWHIFAF